MEDSNEKFVPKLVGDLHTHGDIPSYMANVYNRLAENLKVGAMEFDDNNEKVKVEISDVESGQLITVTITDAKEINSTIMRASRSSGETGLQTVVTASHTRTFIDTEKSEISHHFLLDDRVGRYRDVYNITSLSRDIELAIKASNLLANETDRTMSMLVRERGVQVDELRTIERRQIAQIVNASFIVNECLECPKRYDDCAAGIAIKIKSDADKYDGLGGDDKSRLRKEVHSLPKLLKIANECIESVAGIGQPIYVDYEQILAESFPDLG